VARNDIDADTCGRGDSRWKVQNPRRTDKKVRAQGPGGFAERVRLLGGAGGFGSCYMVA
jgi:hypothetical protein